MNQQHPDVKDYLKRLDRALSHVSSGRRREIVGEIEAHISQAVAELGPEPRDHEIDAVLEGLGDPETIAAEETSAAPQRRSWGAVEIGALILLPIGAFVLPLIGWVIGVVLLWVSSIWTTRDKLIGTFVLPGGLAFPLYLLLFAGASSESCSGGSWVQVFPDGRRKEITEPLICESTGGVPEPLFSVVVLLLVVAVIGSVVYLARRMSRASAGA